MSKNKIYPFAVASVRSMENKLLSQQKLMQMAEAKSAEEALRLLSDTAYGKTQVQDVHQFEEMIETTKIYSIAGALPIWKKLILLWQSSFPMKPSLIFSFIRMTTIISRCLSKRKFPKLTAKSCWCVAALFPWKI